MSGIEFGRLEDFALRDAWKHEARGFTPWLATNIDRLSELIDIPLEVNEIEKRVGPYAADILASDPKTGTVVLIENQLEASDHTHLGQIMTYLAGLEAQVVIWVASGFSEQHISAVRWLNEHTGDEYSFFAVSLRVVRIGESPLAPILEIVESPNNWERSLAYMKREAYAASYQLGDLRQRFWRAFAQRYPEASPNAFKNTRQSYAWSDIIADRVVVVLWVGSRQSGIFVRGRKNAEPNEVYHLLAPFASAISERLGVPFQGDPNQLSQHIATTILDEGHWPELIDWMEERRRTYVSVLSHVLQEGA